MCPLKPEKTPRQQAFIYILLIICTLILLCFYSIPLTSDSSTLKPLSNIIPTAQLLEDDSAFIKDNIILTDDKLLKEFADEEPSTSSSISISSSHSPTTLKELKLISIELPIETTSNSIEKTQTPSMEPTLTDTEESTTIYTKQSTESIEKTNSFSNERILNGKKASINQFIHSTENNTKPTTIYTKQSTESIEKTNSFSNERSLNGNKASTNQFIHSTENNTKPTTIYTKQSTESTEKTTKFSNERSLNGNNASTNQLIHSTENNTTTHAPRTDGFLVYSEHCKIPNIDPYHPSILKYIEETPPLVCKVSNSFFFFF
ncbi:uncharacterized protein TNCT_407951 [Trichonephila clavata]|uniref:Uncharacterized protein n=1 Tax=Trichonephila clavata TaxID=2740835 RepID=A0A8X6LAC5_TRICU|nr:uncharacterized protein TNCT_407951 [Trichonephila clavata]